MGHEGVDAGLSTPSNDEWTILLFANLIEITPFLTWQTTPIDEPLPLSNPIKPLILPLSQTELKIIEQDFEPIVPPNDILLNSWKIRRAGWENLADDEARPFNYKLNPEIIEALPDPTKPRDVFISQVDREEILKRGFEELVEPTGILLDSWKIRRTGFAEMGNPGNFRPYRYQLPTDAPGSESRTPPLVDMSVDVLAEEVFMHNMEWTSDATPLPDWVDAERLFEYAWKIRLQAGAYEQAVYYRPYTQYY